MDAVQVSDGAEVVRRKRRKYALLLSYCGKGYLGMQRCVGVVIGYVLLGVCDKWKCDAIMKFEAHYNILDHVIWLVRLFITIMS